MSARFWALLAVAILCLPAVPRAASIAVTPEQVELLKQVPPAQRALLRKALREEAAGMRLELEAPDEERAQADERQLETPVVEERVRPAEPVRLRPGDTLLIYFREIESQPPVDETVDDSGLTLSAEERARERERREAQRKLRAARLPEHPLFVLDQFGAVTIDNVGRFVLAGLGEAEAAERLSAEPALRDLRVRVKRLPVVPELERFGHDLFTGVPKTFAPATDVPVPADYVVGPGDTIVVQLLGKENAQHELVVTRDGALLFPGMGPINAAGVKFSRLQKMLRERVSRQFIGTQADVTLGRLRSIRVFVLGDVVRPGSYTISGLSTLTNALFASGGVTAVGSLRDIQLKRAGQVVSQFDLYDMLLRGDTRADRRLLPGDVIFVPLARRIVGVSGRVRRPAFYELRDEETVAELVQMAGGLLPDAHAAGARVERAQNAGESAVRNIDLTQANGRDAKVRDGDIVRVYRMPDEHRQTVRLTGKALHRGDHEWRPGMRLSDLISSLDTLQAGADTRYALIKRERREDRRMVLLGADPVRALAYPGGPVDIALSPRDEVHVFGLHEDRAVLIRPLLERASLSASPANPAREVNIAGAVHHPGSYPWAPGMTIEDLIHAGGGLTERAYTLEAELSRYVVAEGEPRSQARRLIGLDRDGGETGIAMMIEPHDRLVVRRIPHWEDEGTVEVLGEVRFPGRYPVTRGERLSELIERAGGLSQSAYPRAAVFLRESVRQREQDYLEQLIAQLERDLVLIKTEGREIGVQKETALLEGETLLRQMRTTRAAGRMVVDVGVALRRGGEQDVRLQAGDKLIIPSRPDDVTVVGEVYYPTAHVYVAGRPRSEYVRMSGGITERGNKRAAYVVHADGSVSPPPGWFGDEVTIGPGDTVIVPVKVDRIGNLKLFTDITQILFQLSVTAAALNSIGVF